LTVLGFKQAMFRDHIELNRRLHITMLAGLEILFANNDK